MGIERRRWESREAEMSASERVNITEDVRKYAAEHGLTDVEAVESGMQEKANEFADKGAEVYSAGVTHSTAFVSIKCAKTHRFIHTRI